MEDSDASEITELLRERVEAAERREREAVERANAERARAERYENELSELRRANADLVTRLLPPPPP